TQAQGRPLAGRTLGIIGIGNIGSRLVRKAAALGLRVLQNDPPLAEATGDRIFRPLDEILPQADIVTLHVPLNGDGPHPTRQMANRDFFAKMKRGAIFINAARGALLESQALLAALDQGQLDRVALDTWEGEPAFRNDVLNQASIATPHIAGHSFEGKAMGTLMVYQAACRHLGREPDWNYEHLLPEPPVPELTLPEGDPEKLLHLATTGVYNIMVDDQRMRELAGLPEADRAAGFERLRQKYPMRREFRYTRITNKNLDPQLREQLTGLEFRLDG
ncbi:MAG: DUF3410 domain-containing protein, partial [Lentisphaerae bacterium]|nr:DUF3410 domain-containing protein [Lentisphaerota bacterium]